MSSTQQLHLIGTMQPQQINSPQAIKNLIEHLKAKKDAINKSKTLQDKIHETFKGRWEIIAKSKYDTFQDKKNRYENSLKIEIAIIEALREFSTEEFISNLEISFERIRRTNTLQSFKGLYHKYSHDEKLRQVIKLISSVYKYNILLIMKENHSADFSIAKSTLKSRIRYSTNCPHCGEISKKILFKLQETKVVYLP
jgi:hypothetical protein